MTCDDDSASVLNCGQVIIQKFLSTWIVLISNATIIKLLKLCNRGYAENIVGFREN